MNRIEFKAQHIYYMGHAVISEKEAPAILKELKKYNGKVYADFFFGERVAIEVIKKRKR